MPQKWSFLSVPYFKSKRQLRLFHHYQKRTETDQRFNSENYEIIYAHISHKTPMIIFCPLLNSPHPTQSGSGQAIPSIHHSESEGAHLAIAYHLHEWTKSCYDHYSQLSYTHHTINPLNMTIALQNEHNTTFEWSSFQLPMQPTHVHPRIIIYKLSHFLLLGLRAGNTQYSSFRKKQAYLCWLIYKH